MKPAELESRTRQALARPTKPRIEIPSHAVELTNGRYTVHLRGAGSGYSTCHNAAVTRAVPDLTCDGDGFAIYLRDIDDSSVWSAGFLPTRAIPDDYSFECDGRVAQFARVDRDIECRVRICVSPQHDFEIRQCRLTNLSDRPRRIELTSYLEWVLGNPAGDQSHPAFSKLFVETSYCRDRMAILARRRPRHPDEPNLCGFHALIGDPSLAQPDAIEFETNRKRFIGRGRIVQNPIALDPRSSLHGETGAVLDPAAALRLIVPLQPHESQEVAYLLGAASAQEILDDYLGSVRTLEHVQETFDDAQLHRSDYASDGSRDASGNGEATRIIIHSAHHATQSGIIIEPNHAPTIKPATQSPTPVAAVVAAESPSSEETLRFENGYGGFSADGTEYVIRIQPDGTGGQHRPPMPWVNVIANEKAGCIVTESGAGYTWAGNSRLNRLTAWHNDPVVDPHSEACWIRDDDAGIFWSPTPGPTPAPTEYVTRHGFGYSTFSHDSCGLAQTTTMFVARDEPLKITLLRIENRTGQVRRLSVFFYLQWALGGLMSETAGRVSTNFDAQARTIWATNPDRDYFGQNIAFSALQCEPAVTDSVSISCDRATFLGRFADLSAPSAIVTGDELDGRTGDGLDACAAWQVSLELPPGGVFECAHLLGEAANHTTARDLIQKYQTSAGVSRELDNVQQCWRESLSAVTVETPDDEINFLLNGWLPYQNLSCRIWGRSAYYQPGGAFGFRDQLQDSAAFLLHQPDITRTQILRHAAQQFVEGDVLHWWHPDTGYGVRTRFSDDLLWLPFITAEYVQKTGDDAILQEAAPFISAPALNDGQQEAYLSPSPSGMSGSLYEHCCRALDRGLTRGSHGLPLIGCGDWNDGFSRVGCLGQGESVWLGFFIDNILERFLPICNERGDEERVARFSEYRAKLRFALNSAGWDGQWYRRAYYDNGHPLGSTESNECQIDAIAQAWAVLSGVAPPARAQMAIAAAERHLVDEQAGLIRLLTPAFDKTPNDAGYIKGYLRGIRENGGQYTHGVLWLVRAIAEMGRGTRAVELLRMLSPISHTNTKDRTDIYQTEPYVVAADVYGEPPHVGRGGWTWYTGSAGWMYRVAVESILGITTEGGQTLLINPSISADWPQCRVKYRPPDGKTQFEIIIENPSRRQHGIRQASFDGRPAEVKDGVARIPLTRDGGSHQVVARL